MAREDATTIPADLRESQRAVEHISTLLGYTGGVAEQFEKTALEKGNWRITDTLPRTRPEPITTKPHRLASVALRFLLSASGVGAHKMPTRRCQASTARTPSG